VVPKAYDPVTVVHQSISSLLIGATLVCMVPAIKLNYEEKFRTTKIRDIAADGMLTTKLCAIQTPVAKTAP